MPVAANARVAGADTEVTAVTVARVIALTFTAPVFDVLFAIRPSLYATSPAVGSRGWVCDHFLITIFGGSPCYFLAS